MREEKIRNLVILERMDTFLPVKTSISVRKIHAKMPEKP